MVCWTQETCSAPASLPAHPALCPPFPGQCLQTGPLQLPTPRRPLLGQPLAASSQGEGMGALPPSQGPGPGEAPLRGMGPRHPEELQLAGPWWASEPATLGLGTLAVAGVQDGPARGHIPKLRQKDKQSLGATPGSQSGAGEHRRRGRARLPKGTEW